jgi:hypothetical protein
MVTPGMTSTLAGVSSGVSPSRLPVCVGTSRLSPGLDWPAPELFADAELLGAGAPGAEEPGACLVFFFATAFFFGSVEVVTSTAGNCTVSAVSAGFGGSTACAWALPLWAARAMADAAIAQAVRVKRELHFR